MAKDEVYKPVGSVLGDITPVTPSRPRGEMRDRYEHEEDEDLESMGGGSRSDGTRHSGARDVTEGVTGGAGTEVGGTRNYRQGSGAVGTDIGNRPETANDKRRRWWSGR